MGTHVKYSGLNISPGFLVASMEIKTNKVRFVLGRTVGGHLGQASLSDEKPVKLACLE